MRPRHWYFVFLLMAVGLAGWWWRCDARQTRFAHELKTLSAQLAAGPALREENVRLRAELAAQPSLDVIRAATKDADELREAIRLLNERLKPIRERMAQEAKRKMREMAMGEGKSRVYTLARFAREGEVRKFAELLTANESVDRSMVAAFARLPEEKRARYGGPKDLLAQIVAVQFFPASETEFVVEDAHDIEKGMIVQARLGEAAPFNRSMRFEFRRTDKGTKLLISPEMLSAYEQAIEAELTR